MARFKITLGEFLFPNELPNSKANFRLDIQVRFEKENGDHAVARVVRPSLHKYWDCDPGHSDAPNYVGEDLTFKHVQITDSTVDIGVSTKELGTGSHWACDFAVMTKIDAWEYLICDVKAKKLERIAVRVIDVKHEGTWSGVAEAIGAALESDVTKAALGIIGGLPGGVLAAAGTAAFEAWWSETLGNDAKEDQILFRRSAKVGEYDCIVHGEGVEGLYVITFNVKSIS